jgi:hypothetical protein
VGGTSKDDWGEVGQRFTELKDRLAERYRVHGARADAEAQQGEDAESADESRHKVEEALRSARDQLDRTFTTVGDTIRDPGTRQSLDRAVSSLGAALANTLSEAGEGIRRRFGSHPSQEPSGDGPTVAGNEPTVAGNEPTSPGNEPEQQ